MGRGGGARTGRAKTGPSRPRRPLPRDHAGLGCQACQTHGGGSHGTSMREGACPLWGRGLPWRQQDVCMFEIRLNM